KIYRATHPKEERARDLAYNYGMTTEEYDEILTAQNGVCATCGRPPNGKYLSIDHDHDTGKVRGLLCDNCNRSLGLTHESIDILAKMINYLKQKNKVEIINIGGERWLEQSMETLPVGQR
ncbi:MAG: endonuclease VII domain-containing protein, partial [Sedimentisphaerales bacterium]|nr:endonuclease VII domain-containing protein [Sedimentisphaerales bacterium]